MSSYYAQKAYEAAALAATDPERADRELVHALGMLRDDQSGRGAGDETRRALMDALRARDLPQTAWALRGWRLEYIPLNAEPRPEYLHSDSLRDAIIVSCREYQGSPGLDRIRADLKAAGFGSIGNDELVAHLVNVYHHLFPGVPLPLADGDFRQDQYYKLLVLAIRTANSGARAGKTGTALSPEQLAQNAVHRVIYDTCRRTSGAPTLRVIVDKLVEAGLGALSADQAMGFLERSYRALRPDRDLPIRAGLAPGEYAARLIRDIRDYREYPIE
jgi:hypothetical protein